jgi:hypothetical protein
MHSLKNKEMDLYEITETRRDQRKKIANTLCTFNAYIVLFHILLPRKARRIQPPGNNYVRLVIYSFGLSVYQEFLFLLVHKGLDVLSDQFYYYVGESSNENR